MKWKVLLQLFTSSNRKKSKREARRGREADDWPTERTESREVQRIDEDHEDIVVVWRGASSLTGVHVCQRTLVGADDCHLHPALTSRTQVTVRAGWEISSRPRTCSQEKTGARLPIRSAARFTSATTSACPQRRRSHVGVNLKFQFSFQDSKEAALMRYLCGRSPEKCSFSPVFAGFCTLALASCYYWFLCVSESAANTCPGAETETNSTRKYKYVVTALK